MRSLVVVFALLLSAMALPDRLLLIPVGKKLLSDRVRYEILAEPSRDLTMGWLGSGLGQSFDFEITGESFNSNRMVNSLDVSYNYTVPVIDFVPGISLGMQDTLGVTKRGRNAYFAVTYRFGNDGELNQDVPTEFTFGFWTRKEGAAFAGVRLPFSETLSLMAEHDSINLSAGFEISPFEGGAFRFVFRESQVMVGFNVAVRF